MNYARNNWINFLYSFGSTICRTDVVGQIIFEVLLAGSIEPIENVFAFIIYDNKNIILDEKLDENKVRLHLGRNTTTKSMDK